MTATGRSCARRELDYYSTPPWVVDAIAWHVPRGGVVLDPAAGDGALLRAFPAPHSRKVALEISPKHRQSLEEFLEPELVCIVDALDPRERVRWSEADLIVMNPPFSKAMDFVRVAIEVQSAKGGTTAALLRIAMLAGRCRADFWRQSPADVYVLSRRPSFTGLGTDSADYAWFVWGPGRGNRWAVL